MACPWSFVDQSTLTRKSMLATKKLGDELFFGSTCKQGEIEVIIIVIGVYTFLGKVALLVDSMNRWAISKRSFHYFCVFLSLFLFALACSPIFICLLFLLSWTCETWWSRFYGFLHVLIAIGNVCIISIAIGIIVQILIMYPIQHHPYCEGIKNLLVLLIGGMPIAMPIVLSIAMAIGFHQLSQHVLHFIPLGFVTWLLTYLRHSITLMYMYGQGHLGLADSKVGVVQVIMKLFDWMQGVITKHMIAIEEMLGMDVFYNDKTRTFTLNKLTFDNNLIEVCKN